MPRHLTVVSMVRNEGGRFFRDALSIWNQFADLILVLDDDSTDNTRELAVEAGAIVKCRQSKPAWGNEAPARKELWDFAMDVAPDDGWLLFLDADMIPARSPRELLASTSSDAWAFVLFDLWAEKQGKLYYREDAYWQGHLHPRIWLIKKPKPQDWTWNDRGIHCGHLPLNFSLQKGAGLAPFDMGLLHGAYLTEALREAKRGLYGAVSTISTSHEVRHAQSIMDPNPRLLPLPFTPEYTLSLPEARNAA